MSIGSADPTTVFGGTWEQIADGRVLMGTTDSSKLNTTAEAGLPNITGELLPNTQYSGTVYSGGCASGAFGLASLETQYYLNSRTSGSGWYGVDFDASRSDPIYGNSTTVQPPALYVYIWKRTA